MTDPSHWETHAGWWQRSSPTAPTPSTRSRSCPWSSGIWRAPPRVLDVGCGEGQVARRAARLGAAVVGLDPTVAQITEAHRRGGGPVAARSDAEHLPIASGAVDAVVMCLVIEHLDPFEPAIHEIARVLRPGGCCLLLLNHPLLQTPGSGWIDDHILEEQYWRVGPVPPGGLDDRRSGSGGQFALHAPPAQPIHTRDG